MTSDRIIVGLSGGLGNQLFQYANGRALSIKMGLPLHLDLSWFVGRKHRQFNLDNFNIHFETAGLPQLLPDGIIRLQSRIARRFCSTRMGAPIFRERSFAYDPSVSNIAGPCYLEGYWQSEKYFDTVRDRIRADLQLGKELDADNRRMMEKIAACDSVAIHVRRGDYLTTAAAREVHAVCDQQYYRAAIEHLASRLGRLHLFAFSDDPVWVRDNLASDHEITVVEINGGDAPHLDLWLMKSCKHFIIANSTLSWWGAWLGVNAQKQVIAPNSWFRDRTIETGDLFPGNWLLI